MFKDCQILGNILDLPKTVVFIFCLSGQTRLYNTFIKSFDFLSMKLNLFSFLYFKTCSPHNLHFFQSRKK